MTPSPPPSLWADLLPPAEPRAALDGDARVDVVVVGGGLTGLWTAHSLLVAQPSASVLVVEAEQVGFGASGRNGGWCSALFPTSTAGLVRRHGRESGLALRRAMVDTIDEVGRVVEAERIDAGWVRGGTVSLARSQAQLARARASVAEAARWGVDHLELLDAPAATQRLAATDVVGGTFTRDCARLQPLALVRGLARAVERRGGRIVEGTRALDVRPGVVATDHGQVRAGSVVVATEAWTTSLPGRERDVVPVYSLVVATRPLDAATWARIGLAAGETFTEERHLVVYGQRTADDRLVFGGRGAPYHWGSGISEAFDRDEDVFAGLRRTIRAMLPALAELPEGDDQLFTAAWGGPLAIPRDWHAAVRFDPGTRVGWAGGYVGDGVATTNLAGRTLADLVLGRSTAATALPWVGHRSPSWEPEPWRWLGVNAGLSLASWADAEERATRRPSVLAGPLGALTGH